MSFQDMATKNSYSSRASRPGVSQSIPGSIFQMTTQLGSLKRLISLIGSPKDSLEIREKIHKLRMELSELSKQTSSKLKEAQAADHSELATREKAIGDAKLARDLETILKDFQSVQRLASDRLIQYPLTNAQPRRYGGSSFMLEESQKLSTEVYSENGRRVVGRANGEERMGLMIENEEIVYNESVIEEREEGIREIQNQIGQVQEIFRDLAALVSEQGNKIDDVEANIEKAHSNVKQGNKQLSGALSKQKTANTLTCWAMIIFVVTMFIAFLVLSS